MSCTCGLAVDTAHPAAFHKRCAGPKRRISAGLGRQAGRALSAARARRALLSDERVAWYAERVITAGSDAKAREIIAGIDSLHRIDGPGPGADGDDDLEHLFPPQPGRQREWEASMFAAAARRDLDADDDEDGLGEFAGLWPPATFEESEARFKAAQLAAAARRDANGGQMSDEEADALCGEVSSS